MKKYFVIVFTFLIVLIAFAFLKTSVSQKRTKASTIQIEKKDKTSITGLNSANFERLVPKCLHSGKCKLTEDPLKMYKGFKASEDKKAIDDLLSFMRSQLRDPAFRRQYKDILKQMIDEFYSPEERQFQEAVYYNDLGDLQKSLDLYLDLRKKAMVDTSLRNAPNLNIANVLYGMKQFREALPYYQAALDDYLIGTMKTDPGPIQFIDSRIDEIRKILSL